MKEKQLWYSITIVLILIFFLLSCEPSAIKLSSTFNLSEVGWFNQKGNNTIIGQAFLRTRSGNVKTCAGYEVVLIPFSRYAEERMKYIYGSTERGIRFVDESKLYFTPDVPEYYQIRKKTVCDARGNFKFTDLPDGEYFIIATVIWEAYRYYPNRVVPVTQGGYVLQRVKVEGGEVKEVIMTY